MYCDFNAIKKSLKVSKGVCTATIPTFKGDVTYTWFDQHNPDNYKDDKKIDGSGCASCATIATGRTFSQVYGNTTPYSFRRAHQQKMFGHMRMPWTPQECKQVIESFGLRTEYYNKAGQSECYGKIKEQLKNGMPVLAWVYAWPRTSTKKDYRYTAYAHVILLAGITKDDKAIILDSGRHGPLWQSDLTDICNHILPGNWLHGFILVKPYILYRVRRTWSNASSQIGAYSRLENAKDKVEEMHRMGETYTVYDSNGVPVWPMYRVRQVAEDAETQIGAFVYFRNAVAECELHPGYVVTNLWDDVLMTATEDIQVPVKVKIEGGTTIFDGPGLPSVGEVENDGIYTITEIKEYNDSYYGCLKSGAGWVDMDDVRANL